MAPPAHVSSEFASDSKRNLSSNMETVRGNSSLLTNPRGKGLRCIKSEDSVLMDDPHTGLDTEEDVAVNINDSTDGTEYSSSFADSASGNEICSGLSDAEVQSQFFADDGLASAFDDFGAMFTMRKKKLTNHWRTYIRPLMWRCKWAELKIKEFGSQAIKCDREIYALNQRKHTSLHQHPVEESGSRSLPYTLQEQKQKVLKRRKRERVEDKVDTKSYMSNHNLFSYLGDKRSYQDGTLIADDLCNTERTTTGKDEFGLNNDWSFLEDKDTYLEQVFQKIEVVHSRVQKLKSQLDVIMSKNAAKFSSSENLSYLVPFDVQTSSVRSPTFSACNGDTTLMGGLYDPIQSISEYDMGDLMLPDSAVSSFGEAIHIPDIIESTVGMLSSVDVTQHYSQMGDSGEDIVDNIPIHNQAAEADEAYTSMTSKNQQSKGTLKHQEPVKIKIEESNINPVLPASGAEMVSEAAMSQEQLTLKSQIPSDFHFPKNKRKRGERKAGMGNWSRQCPGDPGN